MNHLKLGFGTMRLPLTDPNDAAAIDHELLCQMVDTYLERMIFTDGRSIPLGEVLSVTVMK